MQNQPAQWAALFAGEHKTEYRFDINGVSYYSDRITGTPVITKPLLDVPTFGRVCTGQLEVTIYPYTNTDIPKAAPVNAYCRLSNLSGSVKTAWIPQGKYFISSRSGTNPLKLTCLDYMIKTGQTYRDKSAFREWPQKMTAVVNEIASIMGVSIDSRTTLQTGSDYVVSYPNDDTLISEVLGMIGAVHGGSWIMTETGKLRLIPFTIPAVEPQQVLGLTHGQYTKRGKTQTITRVILVDDAENEFTSGDDTGMTISVRCDYATQNIVTALCNTSNSSINKGCLNITNASINKGCLNVSYGSISKGNLNIPNNSVLYGAVYEPYDLQGAYLNPCMELGDTISFNARDGTLHTVVIQTIVMQCTVGCTCNLSAGAEDETDAEYPFISPRDLTLQRTLKTNKTYFGNRITRAEGFVSELLINEVVTARMTANASMFSMQTYEEQTGWVDRIYFNTGTGKYTITADVDIIGRVTFTDLKTSGSTIINGDNITTGTINAERLDLSDYSTTAETDTRITSAIQRTVNGMELSVSTRTSGNNTISTINLSSDGVVISHDVVTGTTAAQAASIATDAVNGIRLNVTNADKSSTLTLTANGTTLSSGTITFTGFVTFTDLSGNGTTTINGGNIKTGTIAANRVDLSSYSTTAEITNMMGGIALTVKSTTSGNNTISTIGLNNGSATISVTGTTATQAANIAADAINGISMSVVNGSSSSTLTLTANGTTLSSKTITFSGMVTFTDLSTPGYTTISGSNIKTGTIDASLVNVTNLNASNITSGKISASRIDTSSLYVTTVYSPIGNVAVTSPSNNYLYVGGSSSELTFKYLYLMASTQIRFCFTSPNSQSIFMDDSEGLFAPASRSSYWCLGNATYKWYSANISTINTTTINATTISASSISTSSLSGISALTVSGNITASRLYFASGSYSLTQYTCDLPSTTVSALSCSGSVSFRGSGSQIRIGSNSDYISFFGRTPTSRPVISTTSISDSNVKTAVVQIINALFALGLASSS